MTHEKMTQQNEAQRSPRNAMARAFLILAGCVNAIEERVLWNLAAALMIAGAALMMMEALSRALLDFSFTWTEEVVRWAVLWAVFLAFGFACRRGHFIRTELLIRHCPSAVRRWINIFNCACGLALACVLVWTGFLQVSHLHKLGIVSEDLRVPLWIVKAGLIVAAASLARYFANGLVQSIRGTDPFVGPDPEETAETGSVI